MGRSVHARKSGCHVRLITKRKTARNRIYFCGTKGLKMVRLKMPGKEMFCFIACFILCGQVNSMGDRWAWGSDVSSRRSQLDTDTKNEVKEIEVENAFSPVDIVEDKNQRTARKVETETPEARFFLKDKLCAIGLADCSNDLSEAVQYVQPVQVVPVGQPIPAVAAQGFQYTVPVENPDIANRDFSVSSGYGAPSYEAPKPSYNSPSVSYGPPKPSYNTPTSGYSAPKPSYDAPSSEYGAPKPSYNAPKPSYSATSSEYGAPKPSYKAPQPSSDYGAPKPTYNTPSVSHGAPLTSYNGPSSKVDTTSSFQTSFSVQPSDLSENTRPVREGRVDECYCVPVGQCPADKILGNSYLDYSKPKTEIKDYSNLINPRVKNSDIGITAPAGRTLIETTNTEETDEKEEAAEDSLEKDVGQERSLVDSIEADYEYIGDEPKISSNAEEDENIEVSRRRRDSLDKEEESPNIEERSSPFGP